MRDELLKGLAHAIAVDKWGPSTQESDVTAVERVLREVGLGELLEAGQALREYDTGRLATGKYLTWTTLSVKWDVARAALAGVEKGREG